MLNVSKWVVRNPNGEYVPLPRVSVEVPSWLAFAVEDTALPYTVPTASGAPIVNFRQIQNSMRYNTPFVATHIALCDSTNATPAAAYRVRLTDVSGRAMMNQPIHCSALLGYAGTPLKLHEPLIIPANMSVRAEFTTLSNADQSIRMYLIGKQLFGPDGTDQRLVREAEARTGLVRPYWLTTDTFESLAQNVPQTYTIRLPVNMQVMALTGTGTNADYTVQITEMNTRRGLMNGTINATNGVGTALFPALYRAPLILPAGSRLQIIVTNTNASAQTVYLTLHGRAFDCPLAALDEQTKKMAMPLDGVR